MNDQKTICTNLMLSWNYTQKTFFALRILNNPLIAGTDGLVAPSATLILVSQRRRSKNFWQLSAILGHCDMRFIA